MDDEVIMKKEEMKKIEAKIVSYVGDIYKGKEQIEELERKYKLETGAHSTTHEILDRSKERIKELEQELKLYRLIDEDMNFIDIIVPYLVGPENCDLLISVTGYIDTTWGSTVWFKHMGVWFTTNIHKDEE